MPRDFTGDFTPDFVPQGDSLEIQATCASLVLTTYAATVSATAAAGSGVNFFTGGQILAHRADTAVPLLFTADNGGPLTGLTVEVEIRDGDTLNSYLDFDDMTFKTSSWVQKANSLLEVGGGHYSDTLDLTSVTNLPDTNHLALEYLISGAVSGVASAVLTFNALFDVPIEGAYRVSDLYKLIAAVLAGKLSGAGTGTITIRDVNDSKDRVIATVDDDGNRSAVTLDVS